MIKRQTGFAVFELVLVVAAVALIGFVVIQVQASKRKAAQPVTVQTAPPLQPEDPVPTVNSAADLSKAEAALDQTDLDSSDQAELDSQSAF
ncbi:hypothetical protein KY386_03985 [Candidatus Parcubacteria bacterium]|nr:hypothetical protein [Candidatus Parcubacteria bacterium]